MSLLADTPSVISGPESEASQCMVMLQTNHRWPAEVQFSCAAHPLLAILLDSQSKPSYRPSPDVAHVLWMYLRQQHHTSGELLVGPLAPENGYEAIGKPVSQLNPATS